MIESMKSGKGEEPRGQLATRLLAMPESTNANGDIFGGWVLSQMDLAGGAVAAARSRSRIATVAIESMSFVAPVKVGDLVSCYTEILQVGRSSMRIYIEVWAIQQHGYEFRKVTYGTFTYVAINEDGKPRSVDRG